MFDKKKVDQTLTGTLNLAPQKEDVSTVQANPQAQITTIQELDALLAEKWQEIESSHEAQVLLISQNLVGIPIREILSELYESEETINEWLELFSGVGINLDTLPATFAQSHPVAKSIQALAMSEIFTPLAQSYSEAIRKSVEQQPKTPAAVSMPPMAPAAPTPEPEKVELKQIPLSEVLAQMQALSQNDPEKWASYLQLTVFLSPEADQFITENVK